MLTIRENNFRNEEQYITIDSLVPKNHLVRKIENAINFEFIYDEVKDLYSPLGAPSIDPVVLIKIVLIQYLFGIPSMRQTKKDIEVNVPYRWFLGYSLTEKIPHFSTFNKNYERRFKDTDLFEVIFKKILLKFDNNKLTNNPSCAILRDRQEGLLYDADMDCGAAGAPAAGGLRWGEGRRLRGPEIGYCAAAAGGSHLRGQPRGLPRGLPRGRPAPHGADLFPRGRPGGGGGRIQRGMESVSHGAGIGGAPLPGRRRRVGLAGLARASPGMVVSGGPSGGRDGGYVAAVLLQLYLCGL